MSKELTLAEKFINAWIKLYADDEIREVLTREDCKVMDEVETALIEKENTDKTINELFSENGKVITTIEIKNKLKALEIIKEKRDDVLLSVIRESKNAHDYNFRRGKNQLTPKEFDLLKEIFNGRN